MKFSKTTGCFYPDDIQYANPPEDLISVSPDDYNVAMTRAAGETLDVQDGRLIIVPPRPGPEYLWLKGAWRFDADLAAQAFKQRQQAAVLDVSASITRQRETASGGASPGEMNARAAKRLAAEAVLAGTATEAQLLNLSTEAQLRGMNEAPEALAAKIVDKALALDAINAKLDGLKRAAENALLATTTDDELDERVKGFQSQVGAVVVATAREQG